MPTHRTAPAILFLLAATTLPAQSFQYPDFSSVTTLSLLGTAVQNGAALRLTNAIQQTGWAWHRTQLPVVAGFDTTFTFRITPPVAGTKAEGMTFVVHDDPNGINTTGGTVWGMGYGNGSSGSVGIRNSIAVEFDTYLDAFLGDTSANELTIHTRGALGNHENEQYSIGRSTPAQNLANGQVHTLRVRYVPGTLEVFVDGAATPAISRPYGFTTGGTYLAGGAAAAPTLASGGCWLGFCATTGANSLYETVEILSWSWTSTPLKDPCYAGSLGQDLLTVNGSTGGLLREVRLATFQPFPIGLLAPAGVVGGAGYVLLLTPMPTPGAPGTALGFGNACMPLLPIGPAVFVLADSFGWLPAWLPASPAPYTLPIPTGLVGFPIDLTLQAVIAASNSPFTLGLTNAIDVQVRPSPAPTITFVNPLSGTPGQSITIQGANFVPGLTLRVNGAPVAPTTSTATQLTFAYPAGLPCGSQVAVQNPDGLVVASALNPTPTVTGTLLGTGPVAGNAIFVVQGTGFAPGTTVTIGGAAATVLSAAATTVTVRTPPGSAGQAQVVLTTPGGCTVTTTYTYQ
ncbi:MAG: IPT/TIG domain-containing protein [Planctomycetota bacterium]|nr:IPT/TIG domain-containing protein [Planctomycetota bacterium]